MQPFLFLNVGEQLFKLLSLLVLGVLATLVTVFLDWESCTTSLFLKLFVVFVH